MLGVWTIVDNVYFWLVVGELIIIAIVVIIKLIFNYIEKRKINHILDFFERRAKEQNKEEEFKQCLDIIKRNKKEG